MSFAHFTLATRDPQKTGAFFEATMGYRQIETPDNSPLDLCWLEISTGQQIHLVRFDNFEISRHEKEFGRHIALFHQAWRRPRPNLAVLVAHPIVREQLTDLIGNGGD